MSARHALALEIAGHPIGADSLTVGMAEAREIAADILAAGYRKPLMITTVDEVDALPNGSVVTSVYGDACTVWDDVRLTKPTAYHHLVKYGPATVLHEPEAPR